MTTTPTQAEVEAAQNVLLQYREAQAELQKAKIQPVADLFDNHDIDGMIEELENMAPEVRYDPTLAPHLTATLVGLQGLRTAVGIKVQPAAVLI